jgi:histone H3/H4
MRDTPRDDLRQLARALAPTSKAIVSSSPRTGISKRRTSRATSFVEDASPLPNQPRMSLSRREMTDDDSFHEAPPRMSVAPEDYEVEGSRRALQRRDRESIGNFDLADFEAIEEEMIEESEGDDHEDFDDAGNDVDFTQLEPGDNETTRNLRALMDTEADEDVDGGYSFGGNTDGEPTFQFRIAERSRLSNAFDLNANANPDEEEEADAGVDESIIAPMSPFPDPDDMEDEEDEQNPDITRVSLHDTQITSRLADMERALRIPNTSPLPEDVQQVIDSVIVEPKSKKALHRSKLGLEYPSLPAGVVKKLAGTFSKSFGGNGKINKETLDAIMEASDWFFEQVSEDLSAYADHAKRKTIEEADVITLMKR